MKPRYLRNISSLSVNTERCIGCGMCIEVCPHDVFLIENRKVKIIDKDACMECGACNKNCPVGAIEVSTGTGGLVPVLEEMITKSKAEKNSNNKGMITKNSKKNGGRNEN